MAHKKIGSFFHKFHAYSSLTTRFSIQINYLEKQCGLKGSAYNILKTIAFIAGKKNPAVQKFYIRFSIEIKLKKLFQR